MPNLAVIGEGKSWLQEPHLTISSNTAVLRRFFASQGRQDVTIKAKYGEKEYTLGPLLHAKIAKVGPDRRRGWAQEPLDFKIWPK